MKKNLFFIVSIFLSLGFFNHNNAISKKEVLGLIGRGTQTAVGSTAVGMSALGLYIIAHTTSGMASGDLFYFIIGIPALYFSPFVVACGLFGTWETYQGVKGWHEIIKKIQNNNTKTHSE